MFISIILVLISVIVIALGFFVYVLIITVKLPQGRAIEMIEKGRPKIGRLVACIGDSLTHGNLGVCWVNHLRHEFPNDKFLNEGINGDVVWQVHERLEPILKCHPDVIKIGRASCRERV